jgi:hypothetical protein
MILVQWPFNRCFHTPVVTVNPFANRAIKRDEMGCAEDQGILGHSNAKGIF